MKIFIGSDHAGFKLKDSIIQYLESIGHEVVDCGTKDGAGKSCDYPHFAHRVVRNLTLKENLPLIHSSNADLEIAGILICYTGIGMSIAANRNRFIRAAICHDTDSADLTRQHNNANILCIGAKDTPFEKATEIIDCFLKTSFVGKRHLRRIKKINPRILRRSFFARLVRFLSKFKIK